MAGPGLEPATHWFAVRLAPDCARRPGLYWVNRLLDPYRRIAMIMAASPPKDQTRQIKRVVSVESSSLFHQNIYLWFICFPWWSIDGLENLHANRTTVCFEPWQKPRARLGSRKTGLSPYPQSFNTERSKAILLLWFLTVTCSCSPYLYFRSAIMLVTYVSKV